MTGPWPTIALGDVIRHRKEFVQIDDLREYKRCRAQLHAKGVVLRDIVLGAEIKTKKQQVCRPGEFLVAEIDAKVGGFGIVPQDLDGAIVSSHYFLFVVDETRLNRTFLDYYVRTPAFREQVGARGSTNYAAIRPAHVLSYRIPLPPLAEQRRIVAKIEHLAAKISEARAEREAALRLTLAALPAALYRIAPTLNDLGQLRDVLASTPRNGWSARCDNADDGAPILALSAVTGYQYNSQAFKRTSLPTKPDAHYWLRTGDLLITRSNTPELVGHGAIYDGTPRPCIYPDLMMRLDVDTRKADTRFVWYWLQSSPARSHIAANAKGTSPTMKKIAQDAVMRIPFPTRWSVAEQHCIVTHLDDLQTKVDGLKALQTQTAAELNAVLPTVLHTAFAGRL